MQVAETMWSTGTDLEEECCELAMEELIAQRPLPESDEEIRLWSYRAYYVTAARCLHSGSGRPAARQAAMSVALSVTAYLAHQALGDDSAEKDVRRL